MDAAVICQGLTKDYGRGRGIFDLDLEVIQGETLGLVGPNGAGKTTAIRLLMDLPAYEVWSDASTLLKG